MKKIISISALIVLFDQLIKLVVTTLGLHNKLSIIPNFFYITYVRNDGAAWSILSGNRILLITIGIIAIVILYFLLIYKQELNNLKIIYYSILNGGIIGNLLDRIFRGYVIDYLDFKIFNYYFPVFNLADIMIVIGTFLVIIEVIRGDKNGEIKSNQK